MNKLKKSDFGFRLKQLCDSKKLTIVELARQIGISPKTIHEWVGENGRWPRNPNYLKRLCEHLEVDLNWLLLGESLESTKQQSNGLSMSPQEERYEVIIRKLNGKKTE